MNENRDFDQIEDRNMRRRSAFQEDNSHRHHRSEEQDRYRSQQPVGQQPGGQRGQQPGSQQAGGYRGQQPGGQQPGGQRSQQPGGQQPGGQRGQQPGGQRGQQPGGQRSQQPDIQQRGQQRGQQPGGQQRSQQHYHDYQHSYDHQHHSSQHHHSHHHSHHHHRQKKNKGWIAIVVVAAVVVLLGVVGIFGLKNAKSMLAQANKMKSNLTTAITCIKEKDPDGAESAIEKADSVYKEINKTLNGGFWKIASKMPFIGGDVKSVKELMNIYGNASDSIVKPFITQMRNYPLSNLKVDGGFNVSLVNSYMDFADSIGPQIDDINKRMQNIKFKVLPKEKIEGILGKFSGLMQTFDSFKKYAPLIRAFCGSGENKAYLVLAQNSAEIRASGGFPGSVGTITITDGILRVGDFSSIVNFINIYYPDDFVMPEREIELFGNDYSYLARDADYNPNFERMASLIKLGYNYELLDHVDGVVSFTPIVIERLLKYTGASFTIDDGSQITGDNAMQIIQRELYYKQGTGVYTNDYVDSLFSEVAKKAMTQFVEGFDVKKVAEYVTFFEEGFADRSVMIWIDNPEAEEVVKQCGCSGNVNFDPTKPEAGVFFSCWNAARLGMHIDIQPTIVGESTNDKGQKEYNIEVKYYNAISEEEIGMGSYIAGGFGGSIPGYIYFFAPAGGTISDINASNGLGISISDYAGLQVGYSKDFWIDPGQTIVVSYKVTTAEGADPLRIVMTPTIRNAK